MLMIEVKNLTKDFGYNRGVFDISFEVKEGEVFGFLGPNGAGKTTTIRMLMGFSQPDKGTVSINSNDCWKDYSSILGEVGYIPGEVALPDGLSGLEFIDMMKKMRHAEESRVTYLLDLFELNPNQSMRKMSIGDKRKLAIVSAFMSDPKISILDEPTSGLDPIIQNNENKVFKIEFLEDKGYEQFMKSDLNIIYSDKTKKKVRVAINDKEINRLIKEVSDNQVKYFSESQFTLEDYFLNYYKDSEVESFL